MDTPLPGAGPKTSQNAIRMALRGIVARFGHKTGPGVARPGTGIIPGEAREVVYAPPSAPHGISHGPNVLPKLLIYL